MESCRVSIQSAIYYLGKTADVNKLASNAIEWVGGYVLLQFQGTFSEISFRIPIVEYTYTFGYSGFNFGIPDVQACPTVTCNNNNTCETGESCNCADCTNGGTDDKDKCGLTTSGAQMECTKIRITQRRHWILTLALLRQILLPLMQNSNRICSKAVMRIYRQMNLEQLQPISRWPKIVSLLFSLIYKRRSLGTRKELLSIPDSKPVLWSKTSDQYGNTWSIRFLFLCYSGYTEYTETNIFCHWVSDWWSWMEKSLSHRERFPVWYGSCIPYNASSVSYIPNTSPLIQWWSNINGIGTAQNDGWKLVCKWCRYK